MAIPPIEFVQRGEEGPPITKEEAWERFKSPNAVRRNLFDLLAAWEAKARRVLADHHFPFCTEMNTGFPDTWPVNAKNACSEVKDAWRVLMAIGNLHVKKGNLCEAMNLHEPIPHQVFALVDAGIGLGLAIMEAHTRPYTQPAAVGKNVKGGGNKGAVGKHGTPEERDDRYNAMRQRYHQLHADHPKWGHYDITNCIGKEFKRSGHCVREHVPNTVKPRPRKPRKV